MSQISTEEQAPKRNADVKAPPPNIHSYLFKVGIMEIRYIRMLASLCSLTYTMTRMSVGTIIFVISNFLGNLLTDPSSFYIEGTVPDS